MSGSSQLPIIPDYQCIHINTDTQMYIIYIFIKNKLIFKTPKNFLNEGTRGQRCGSDLFGDSCIQARNNEHLNFGAQAMRVKLGIQERGIICSVYR